MQPWSKVGLRAALGVALGACAPAYENELEDVARTRASADLGCEIADVELDVSISADHSDAHVVAAGCGHALQYRCYRRPASSRTWRCGRVSY